MELFLPRQAAAAFQRAYRKISVFLAFFRFQGTVSVQILQNFLFGMHRFHPELTQTFIYMKNKKSEYWGLFQKSV